MPVVVAHAMPLVGPVLAGRDVVWVRSRRFGSVVLRASPHRRPRVVYRVSRTYSLDELRGSRSGIAVGRGAERCDRIGCSWPYDVVVSGPSGGRLRVLGPRPPAYVESLAVDGARVAYLVELRHRRRLVVRDIRSGRRLAAANVRVGRDVRIAGRFVAWRTSAGVVVVYDLVRQTVRYRTPFRRVESYDLQADGKVAAVVAEDPQRRAAYWLSTRGHAHRLQPADPSTEVRIASDRVVYRRSTGRGRSSLVVDDLRGGELRLWRVDARNHIGNFDFDGRRVTWAAQHVVRVEHPPCLAYCTRYVGPSAIYVARVPR